MKYALCNGGSYGASETSLQSDYRLQALLWKASSVTNGRRTAHSIYSLMTTMSSIQAILFPEARLVIPWITCRKAIRSWCWGCQRL